MVFLIASTILPHYFKRHRGRAFAFLGAGACTGQMAGPPLITYLQQEYGFRGATIIMAALLLNSCVAAAVFHPVEWHTGKSSRNYRNTDSKPSLDNSKKENRCCVTLQQIFSTLVTNFKILKSPKTLIILFGACFIQAGYLNFFSIVPFVMVGEGYTQEEASWCMSVSGICNLVTRLVVCPLTDWPRCSKRACYMVGTAAMALTTSGKILLEESSYQRW